MSEDKIRKIIGETINDAFGLTEGSEIIKLQTAAGTLVLDHSQDCCERVYVAEVHGDPDWLVGAPIVRAEERVNSDNPEGGESSTWTFYEFATIKGSVTVRWCGESNGYYSESVSVDWVTR